MTTPQELLSAAEQYITDKELILAAKQIEVLAFIKTKHKAQVTQGYLGELGDFEQDIYEMLIPLLHLRAESSELKAEATRICEQSRELKTFIKDIKKNLSDDLIQRQKDESSDLIKEVGFVAAMVLAVVNIAKNTIDLQGLHGTLEAVVGAVIGTGVVFHKKICATFRSSAKNSCELPKKIGTRMLEPLISEKSFLIVGRPANWNNHGNDSYKRLNAA